jgi:hypothetical protein
MPHGCLRQHLSAQCSRYLWINLRIVLVLSPFPTPATIRPTIICGMPYEVAWSTAPIERITEPAMIHHRRPSRSPTRRDMIAPKKQPCLLSVCADAWIPYEQSHRLQPCLHGQSWPSIQQTIWRRTYTVPCNEEFPCPPTVVSISGNTRTKASPVRRPDMTPWSYPNLSC